MEEFFAKAFEFLASAQGASATIAIILEFAFRMIPSEKPKSLLYVIAYFCNKAGDLLSKIGSFLDKVIGQKLK